MLIFNALYIFLIFHKSAKNDEEEEEEAQNEMRRGETFSRRLSHPSHRNHSNTKVTHLPGTNPLALTRRPPFAPSLVTSSNSENLKVNRSPERQETRRDETGRDEERALPFHAFAVFVIVVVFVSRHVCAVYKCVAVCVFIALCVCVCLKWQCCQGSAHNVASI